MNLREALLSRDRPNSLNLVRLLLATTVIVAHSWPLGGFGAHPAIGEKPLGEWAVAGFFCLSGFLIAASRSNLPLPRFLWNRALRILPGFWVCLVVVGLVAAPAVAALTSETYSLASGVGYVRSNAVLYIFQQGVGDTLLSVPYPVSWDGSLWTLFYEVVAYLAAGLLLTGWLRAHPAAPCLALLIAGALVLPWVEVHVSTNIYRRGLELALFFLAGMVVHAFAKRLPVSAWWALGSAVVLVGTVALGIEAQFAALPLAYLLLWAGAAIPARWAQNHDISYGMYVYAFPVQQVLAVAGAQMWGWWAFFVLSVALTTPLAWASWLAVERPALSLKRRNPRSAVATSA